MCTRNRTLTPVLKVRGVSGGLRFPAPSSDPPCSKIEGKGREVKGMEEGQG
jgi:hypothetical protein